MQKFSPSQVPTLYVLIYSYHLQNVNSTIFPALAFVFEKWKSIGQSIMHGFRRDLRTRVCPRFFDQVGHETMYASSENKHFSLNLVSVRLTKIVNRAEKNMAHF